MIPKKDAKALLKIIELFGRDEHKTITSIHTYIQYNTRHDNRTDRQREQSKINGAKGGRPIRTKFR